MTFIDGNDLVLLVTINTAGLVDVLAKSSLDRAEAGRLLRLLADQFNADHAATPDEPEGAPV